MASFWVQPEDVDGETLVLRAAEAHHLVRVRRGRVGQQVEVVDGRGEFYQTTILAIEPSQVRCRILARLQDQGESRVRLCLAPALVKSPRFDFIIEKATEVGVDAIMPLSAARAVVLAGANDKRERWLRLARAAVKQCGRCRLPQIWAPAPLEVVIERLQCEGRLVLMANPVAGQAILRGLLAGKAATPLGLLVGPEGGFAVEERLLAERMGVACFSWGERVLRADTAGVVLAGLVLYEAEQALPDPRFSPASRGR